MLATSLRNLFLPDEILPPRAASVPGWPDLSAIARDRERRQHEYSRLVVDYYEIVTPTYRKWGGRCFHFVTFKEGERLDDALRRLHLEVARDARINSASKVLDVGCGLGGPTVSLAELSGARITGLNISPIQLRECYKFAYERCVNTRVNFVHGDFMSLPFVDESFDAVVFFESLCHAPDKQRYIDECARVLRPGGWLSGTDWAWRRLLNNDEYWLSESVCANHAVPYLSTANEIVTAMRCSELTVHSVVDLAEEGDFIRNWEDVEKYDHDDLDPTEAMVIHGAMALKQAVATGLFGVFHYTAQKLARNDPILTEAPYSREESR